MGRTVLITGGAGFIGSHAADELLRHGWQVRVLDSLAEQVHGPRRERPRWLDPSVELRVGDVRDRETVRSALEDVHAVLHLAAVVGVGQSMVEMAEYTDVNALGTAVLLEQMLERPVDRFVVASSMSVYGEGAYTGPDGKRYRATRTAEQLRDGVWEPLVIDPATGSRVALKPLPISEDEPVAPASIYALTKYAEERMVLLAGAANDVPSVALRLFTTYGPRQALANPDAGVLAVFAAHLRDGRQPPVFEDGAQLRDFVSVHDVARACRLALEADGAVGRALNIGSGTGCSIMEAAERLASALGRDLAPELSGRYRPGDVRHSLADISAARTALDYEPEVPFDDGLAELADWIESGAGAEQLRAWDHRGVSP